MNKSLARQTSEQSRDTEAKVLLNVPSFSLFGAMLSLFYHGHEQRLAPSIQINGMLTGLQCGQSERGESYHSSLFPEHVG